MYKIFPILLFAYGLAVTTEDIYDNSWAVIIGIDDYHNHSNLQYAVEDAKAVNEMLLSKFNYSKENVKLLLNEDATKTNIQNTVADISVNAGENDRILLFFAGHGITMPLPDGGEMGYLLPIDGHQDKLYASAIPMDDLKRLSYISKAKHMLFLVDACYGGLAAIGSRGLEPSETPNYLEKISNFKSRQIITAGGKDEEVFEKSEWGHSAYTKNLLSALNDGYADSNEDGYITADELGDYLSEKVSIDSENQQTPQSHRLTSHEGEFIFINHVEDLTIHSDETAIVNTSSRLDYDLLADKIAKKLRKERTVELDHEDKLEGINISLDSKRQKGITVFGAISLAKLNGRNLPATGASSGDGASSDGNTEISIDFPINMELDNLFVPAFGIEKRFGIVIAGIGYYSCGYSMDLEILYISMTTKTKINYLNIYSVYPYSINERITVGAGFGLGIPISGTTKATFMNITQDSAIKTGDMKMDISLLINASYELSERYGLRFYYQHGLTELGVIVPPDEDNSGFEGLTNRIAGVGLLYRF